MGAEFPASALSLVGNFNGVCVIHLTGAAITVRRPPSTDIATWPYNCIRQFRADDDTGRFSFVSGRRGPFGVAEYIFELSDQKLSELQNALTQFTGAQFSHVIPGADSVNTARPTSVSSSSSRKSSGGRADSVSSTDSAFSSPVHRIQTQQCPKLPPRDYPLPGDAHPIRPGSSPRSTLNDSSRYPQSTSRLTQSHSTDMLSEARKRRSQTVSEDGYISSQTPPTRHAPQSSPLTKDSWVMKSQSYESTRQLMGDRSKPAAVPKTRTPAGLPAMAETPPTLPPRDYPLPMGQTSFSPDFQTAGFSRTTDDLQPSHLKKQITEPAFATLPKSPPKRDHRSSKEPEPMESNLDNIVSSSAAAATQKRSNYDRLEKLPENSSSSAMERGRSKSFSPDHATTGSSTEQDGGGGGGGVFHPSSSSQGSDDCSSLDFLPRSSPHVQHRPITPEYAHHLRKIGDEEDAVINRSKTIKGRRSPEGKVLTKISTSPAIYHHQKGGVSSDQTYNVPKSVLYEQNQSDNVYHVPRPQGGVVIDDHAYHVPRPQGEVGQDGVYSVPRPSFTPRKPQHNYHVPIPSHEASGNQAYYSQPSDETDGVPQSESQEFAALQENLYNVPRANGIAEDATSSVGLYNVPPKRSGSLGERRSELYDAPPRSSSDGSETENIYKVPRNIDGTHHDRDNQYEVISTNLPPPPYSSSQRMRPARSCESLATLRVNLPPPRAASNSPPDMVPQTHQSKNQYVDIDVGQAATPPTPCSPLGDNLYAVIPDNFPVRFNQSLSRQQQQTRPLPGGINHHYSTLPPGGNGSNFKDPPQRRPSPESMSGHVLKARQLSKEGYEYCMPATEDAVSNGNNNQSVVPQPQRGGGVPHPHGANYYKVSDPTPPRLIGPRHYSTSDILDASHTSTAAPSTALLGSSIPNDSSSSSALADEYVIVTRGDPSVRLHSQPLNIPPGQGSEVKPPHVGAGDEYELMNPAARAHIKPQPARYDTPDPSLYSTPNPTSSSQSSPPSNAAHLYGNVAHTTTTSTTDDPPTSSVASDGEYGNVRRQGSDDLTGMSPVETDGAAFSVSPPSEQGSEGEGQSAKASGQEGEQQSTTSPIEIEKKQLIRIASGSPNDVTVSMVFKNQTRSLGNVLDQNGAAPLRKHTYVNVPKDGTSDAKQPPIPMTTAGFRKKPPKPLPRSALLRASEAEEKKDHPYMMVELDKVKGNDNPLSSKEPDSPQ